MQYSALKTDTIFPTNMTPEGQAVADAQSTSDYYPFGSPLPGRGFDGGSYRFGFNGKEKDDETYGAGNEYDFGARIYDARVGRWFTVDFYANKFPALCPYSAMENNPLSMVDIGGDSTIYYSESGEYLWTSWDTKRDAICIISNKNLPYFRLALRCARSLGVNRDNNKVNAHLRGFGDCYAVRDFERFFDETKIKYRNKKNSKYGNEIQSYLYSKGGYVTVGKERIVGDPGNVDDGTDVDPATGTGLPQEPNDIGEIHSHVNSGMLDFELGLGVYDDGPTGGADYKFDGNQFWDVEVSPSKVYLTRKDPRNIAAEQTLIINRGKTFARGAEE